LRPATYQLPYWQQTSLPIWLGPLSGSRWLPASGGKLVRLLCGTYEQAQTRLFQQHVTADSVVFDLGAHVGYYSLLGAKLASAGQVVAFEPEPRNAAFLRALVAANTCNNVGIHELAVAAESGSKYFAYGTGSGTGHLADRGAFRVPTISLDEFVELHDVVPTHIKMDVEGAEYEVLCGSRETLMLARPTIFLSTHGSEVHDDCCRFLQALNYDLQPIEGDSLETAESILCVG
jgi:FkbM family methyltransferase